MAKLIYDIIQTVFRFGAEDIFRKIEKGLKDLDFMSIYIVKANKEDLTGISTYNARKLFILYKEV